MPPQNSTHKTSILQSLLPIVLITLLVMTCFQGIIFQGKTIYPTRILRTIEPWLSELNSDDQIRIPNSYIHSRDETGDIAFAFVPFHQYLYEAVKNGRLPLWNDRMYSGFPFLASASPAVLSPINWLFIGMEPIRAYGWKIVLFVFLHLCFTYSLARHLKLSRSSSLFSSLCCVFSVFNVGWMHNSSLYGTLVFMPVTWLFYIRYLDSNSFFNRNLVFTSIFLALMWYAAHFTIVYHCLILLFLYTVYFIVKSPVENRQIKKGIFSLFFAVALSIVLGAAQILPSVELARQSGRSQLFYHWVGFSYHDPIALLGYVFYRLIGYPTESHLFGTLVPTDGQLSEAGIGYIGLFGIFFFIYWMQNKKYWDFILNGKYFTQFLIFTLLLILGIKFTPLYLLLPFPALTKLEKTTDIFVLALSLLAGYGFEKALQDLKDPAKKIILLTKIQSFLKYLAIGTLFFGGSTLISTFFIELNRTHLSNFLLANKNNFIMSLLPNGDYHYLLERNSYLVRWVFLWSLSLSSLFIILTILAKKILIRNLIKIKYAQIALFVFVLLIFFKLFPIGLQPVACEFKTVTQSLLLRGHWYSCLIFLSLCLSFLFIFYCRPKKLSLSYLILTLTFVDGFIVFYDWNEMSAPYSLLQHPTIKPDDSLSRITRFNENWKLLPQNIASSFGFQDAQGFNGLALSNYTEFYATVNPDSTRIKHTYNFENEKYLEKNLFKMLNVKYVLSNTILKSPLFKLEKQNPGFKTYEYLGFLDRFFLVNAAEYFTNQDEVKNYLATHPNFDPSKLVLINKKNDPVRHLPTQHPAEAVHRTSHQVLVKKYSAEKVELSIISNEASYLVASIPNDGNWIAHVDGNPVKTELANYTFMAVPMTKGTHSVTFKYDPFSFKLGALLSIFTLLALFILVSFHYLMAKKTT